MTYSSACYDQEHEGCDLEECECDCHGFDDDGGDKEESAEGTEDDEEEEEEDDEFWDEDEV